MEQDSIGITDIQILHVVSNPSRQFAKTGHAIKDVPVNESDKESTTDDIAKGGHEQGGYKSTNTDIRTHHHSHGD